MNSSLEKQRINSYQKFPGHIKSIYNSVRRQNYTNQQEVSSCLKNINYKITYPFQPSVAFHIETGHLFCRSNQMTGFHMKCNTKYFSVYANFPKKHDIPQSFHNTSIHKIDNVTLTSFSKCTKIHEVILRRPKLVRDFSGGYKDGS